MNTRSSAGPDVGAWYALYAPRLRTAARRILGNDHDAEDATHDAFVAAFRFHDRYHASLDPYPWLHRIATRKAFTLAASQRLLALGLEAAEEMTAPSAEHDALARIEERRIRAMVAAELPVALHALEGLRFREISERLGIPAATAATRVRRGKRRLRLLLTATNPRLRESKLA